MAEIDERVREHLKPVVEEDERLRASNPTTCPSPWTDDSTGPDSAVRPDGRLSGVVVTVTVLGTSSTQVRPGCRVIGAPVEDVNWVGCPRASR